MARRTVIICLAVMAAAMLYIAWRYDPVGGEFPYPRCSFKLLTGLDCPGCGSTRALHALTHLRFGDAWAANPAMFIAMPLAALAFVAEMRGGSHTLRRVLFSPGAITGLIAAIVIWTIIRNC